MYDMNISVLVMGISYYYGNNVILPLCKGRTEDLVWRPDPYIYTNTNLYTDTDMHWSLDVLPILILGCFFISIPLYHTNTGYI